MRFKKVIAGLTALSMAAALCPGSLCVKAEYQPDMPDPVMETGIPGSGEIMNLKGDGISHEEDLLAGLESGEDYVDGQVILILREGSGAGFPEGEESELPGISEEYNERKLSLWSRLLIFTAPYCFFIRF